MNSLWILVVPAILWVVSGQSTGCIQSEYFISLNETITPPEQVTVSSWLTGPFEAPPRNVLHFGENGINNLFTWCTVTSDPDLYVVINFTEPVLITSFIASGSTLLLSGLNIFYASNFTLEYTQRNSNGTAEFVYYRNPDGDIKYFEKNDLISLFTLKESITTESIRLTIHDWVHLGFNTTSGDEITCLGVGLIGCTASEGVEVTASTEEVTSSTEGSTTPTEEMTTIISITAEQVIIRDYQVLEIALPIALLTIIIVLVLVVIGVVLSIRCRSHKYEIPVSTTPMQLLSPGQTLRTLDNSALYNSPSEIGNEVQYEELKRIPITRGQGSVKVMDNSVLYNTLPATRSGTIKTYKNELYGEVETESDMLPPDRPDKIYSEVNVLSSPPPHRDSMEENSAYVSSEGEGSTTVTTPTTRAISAFRDQQNDSYGHANKKGNETVE